MGRLSKPLSGSIIINAVYFGYYINRESFSDGGVSLDNIKFGKFIKQLRSENNMTQKQLAEKLFITDKAVSKWERGLSMPDVSLLSSIADIFGVTVSELLNGERDDEPGGGDDPDTYVSENEVQGNNIITAQENNVDNETDAKNSYQYSVMPPSAYSSEFSKTDLSSKFNKFLNIVAVISVIGAGVLLVLQAVYYYLNITQGIEYPYANEANILNELFVILISFGLGCLLRKKKQFIIFFVGVFLMLSYFNLSTYIAEPKETVMVDHSPVDSNCAIVKRDEDNGKIVLFRPAYGIFCREHDVITDTSTQLQNTQWINSDVCLVTYATDFGNVKGYAATYGDRSSDGNSYYSVSNAVMGTWNAADSGGDSVSFISDLKGIKITYNGSEYTYNYSNIKQYGTTALILSGEYTDEYIIALNEDCVIDETAGLIKNGGTVSLCRIGETSAPVKMYCETVKSNDLSYFNVVTPNAGEYEVYNGVIYYSYDGENTLTAPSYIRGDKLCDNGSQVNRNMTYFTVREENGARIYYISEDSDEWKDTFIQLSGFFEIGSMGFIDENNIYMLAFIDFAMTDAFGSIKYTSDGGKTWSDRFYGIGENDYIHFKIDSKCLFTDKDTAFLTMPSGNGDKSELYISTDGGRTFSLLTFSSAGDYDFYNIPTFNDGVLTVENTMGSDADNTSLSKIFVSEDNGKTWTEK